MKLTSISTELRYKMYKDLFQKVTHSPLNCNRTFYETHYPMMFRGTWSLNSESIKTPLQRTLRNLQNSLK